MQLSVSVGALALAEKPELPRRRSVVVADHDPVARERIHDVLARHAEVEVVASCATGKDALHAIQRVNPDLAFLEVELPDLDAFAVLEKLSAPPHVILLSAHRNHALRAFSIEALDYVLKPIDDERLARAVDRGRRRLRFDEQISAMQRFAGALGAAERVERYLSRVAGKKDDKLFVFAVRDVAWVESAANYARIHVGNESYLIRRTLLSLENDLDPARFVRVSRTAIVNIDHVVALTRTPRAGRRLLLNSGAEIPASPMYRWKLQQIIGRSDF